MFLICLDDHDKEDEDDVAHRKLKISLPATLEKITFKTNTPLELVDHSSTALKYLVVEKMTSLSFLCPNLKVLICDEIELDSTSLPQLVHSLSQSVKLAKVALVSMKINDSVSLQPLIDLLSAMTGLTHLKLTSVSNNSPDSIDFDQEKFPSLDNLYLNLLQNNIVIHLTDSFTLLELNGFKGSSPLKLKGPQKNYSLYGSRVEILCDEQLNELVEMVFRGSSQIILEDIALCFRIPFDLLNLQRIQFQDVSRPLDETLATRFNGLTSMSFHFHQEPSFAVIQGHLKTASKFKQLTTLEFTCENYYEHERKRFTTLKIRREDFPSLKKVIWILPLPVELDLSEQTH